MVRGVQEICRVFAKCTAGQKVNAIRWLLSLKLHPLIFMVFVVMVVAANETAQKFKK